MKIKKISGLLSPLAKVLNIHSDSKENTYSCDYINKNSIKALGTNTSSNTDTYNCNYINNNLLSVYKLWLGNGDETKTTPINVNGISAGGSYLLCYSNNTNVGNATRSTLHFLRCGCDSNNYSIVQIADSNGTSDGAVSYSVDANGYLKVRSTHGNAAFTAIKLTD